jgi:hypothetical protein
MLSLSPQSSTSPEAQASYRLLRITWNYVLVAALRERPRLMLCRMKPNRALIRKFKSR